MADTEHRDVYIAAAVGGVALVLIYLYMHSTPAQAAATDASGAALPSVVSTPPELPTPYTYNVEPYNPQPGIQIGATPTQNKSGCCDNCGPSSGSNYFNTTVAQFQTLMGYGAAAGA